MTAKSEPLRMTDEEMEAIRRQLPLGVVMMAAHLDRRRAAASAGDPAAVEEILKLLPPDGRDLPAPQRERARNDALARLLTWLHEVLPAEQDDPIFKAVRRAAEALDSQGTCWFTGILSQLGSDERGVFRQKLEAVLEFGGPKGLSPTKLGLFQKRHEIRGGSWAKYKRHHNAGSPRKVINADASEHNSVDNRAAAQRAGDGEAFSARESRE